MGRRKRALLEGTNRQSYQLQTDEERAALKVLKPPWGKRKHSKMFRQAVLSHLALIDAVRRSGVEQAPKNRKVAESFDRRAKKVRNFVDHMKLPMRENLAVALVQRMPPWPPPFEWCTFPEDELLSYAAACERGAAFFRRQPRHAADPQRSHLVELLNFVRLHTGRPHLNQLATLLKRPCGDTGMNAKRLDQLLRDRAAQYPKIRRKASQAKAGIGAFLAEQIIKKPPAL